MIARSLSGAWQFRQAGAADWLPASVPGGVHTDLLVAGRLPDPFVADNEHAVQWVAEQDWEYRRTFHADPELLASERVFLVCDGLDTLADLELNGQALGSAENMFRQDRWEVGALLRPGENELRVRFRSPVRYVSERQGQRPMPDVNDVIHGGPYLRKAPSHFGWDWGPKLAAIGIWRDIRLEGRSVARLDDVHLRQQHADEQVTLTASISAERWEQGALRASLRLTAPDGHIQQVEAQLSDAVATLALPIERPQLWWPRGYGEQPLYRVTISLASDETVLDEREYQIGLRTIELRQEPDEWGRSFTFVVNGVPIFAKGANWIPADSFPARVSPARLEHLIGSAAAANHNMLRIWGGGYYEDELFYDLCDRLGLLVWQDFMFACALYPLHDPALLESIRAEVADAVRRLRHRACLALWCGNNEIEVAWAEWGWDTPDHADLKAAYDRFFHQILPEWVAADDPDLPYWPSSPSSGQPFAEPNSDRAGDVHQWQVWHALKPFSNYRTTLARFVSEFGFQSLPSLATIASFAEPAEWNMTSYVMEHHQKNAGGNGRIMAYLTEYFRLPRDFDALVYLSQLLQAEAMRVGVEHWRRHPACAGALYWQLNDCWPVASWASIDYYGRWKAAHYASRRFFAPLLLSVEDEGDSRAIFVTSDAGEPWAGRLRWSLESLRGERLDGGEAELSLPPRSTARVLDLEFAGRLTPAQRRSCVLVCELWQGDRRLQLVVTPFVPSKHLALEEPQIEVEIGLAGADLSIRLTARSLARFVELSLAGADVIFSDNHFDLPAGREVLIDCRLPDGWDLAQARQALRVRSLYESY